MVRESREGQAMTRSDRMFLSFAGIAIAVGMACLIAVLFFWDNL